MRRPVRLPGALLVACLVSLAAGCGEEAGSAAGPELETLFRVDGLDQPESVAWDSARDRWLVTSVGGGQDGGGYISAIDADGEGGGRRIFGTGVRGVRLDGPRGIAVRGDRAYVTDLHRLVALDLEGDSVVFELRLPESESLNDVALDDRGVLYVSDTGGDAIYRVAPDGSGWDRMAAVGSLRSPNGLLHMTGPGEEHRLAIAGWEGAVLTLNPDTSVTLLAESSQFRHLDGIQRSPAGDLLVSDHSTGRLHLLERRREQVWRAGASWLRDLDRPADFAVLGDTLALPELGAGRVTFYRIRD